MVSFWCLETLTDRIKCMAKETIVSSSQIHVILYVKPFEITNEAREGRFECRFSCRSAAPAMNR